MDSNVMLGTHFNAEIRKSAFLFVRSSGCKCVIEN